METFERRWRLLEILLEGPQMRDVVLEKLYQRMDLDEEDPQGLSASNLSADVKALREMGIGFRPLGEGDKKTKQAYELDYNLLSVFANRDDAAALMTAANLLRSLKLPEATSLERLFGRIPGPVRDGLALGYSDPLLKPGPGEESLETIRLLQQALSSRKPMVISYRSVKGKARRYYVETGQLKWEEGSVYLLAHCPEEAGERPYEKNREFRIDRFCRIEGYPLVEVKKDGIRKVNCVPSFPLELLVEPTFAPHFEAVPNLVRIPEILPDGTKRVIIHETVPLRAVRRVLSYGGRVRVVAPDFVKDELRNTLSRMLEPESDA